MKTKKIIFLLLIIFIPFSTQAAPAAVVTAHEEATEAGAKILKAGGTAAEAAIAAAFVLSVVEPEMSGIGGGGFLLYYEKSTNRFFFIDYREAAPLAARNEDYLKEGKPNGLETTGGKAIAVPGFVAGMDKIYKRFGGRLPWSYLLQPAQEIAANGFEFSPKLLKYIQDQKKRFVDNRDWELSFWAPTQEKKPIGKFTKTAETISFLMKNGGSSFYSGELAEKILKDLKSSDSSISSEDFKKYQVYISEPKKFTFRDLSVITAPLPSTGGLLLEQLLFASQTESTLYSSQTFPAFLETQLTHYFNKRKELRDNRTDPFAHTTHLCVVDKQGNMAAMTNSLNLPFGSGVVLSSTGLLMNNHMADFNFDPKMDSKNQIYKGNRPLSSMSPTIVMRGFNPDLIIGTPGGLTIPINLFQILAQHYLEKISLTQAIKSPKFYYFPDQKEAWYENGFEEKHNFAGLKITPNLVNGSRGNVQAIKFDGQNLKTFSDPRGEGKGVIIHE